jgi:hypothetical protein
LPTLRTGGEVGMIEINMKMPEKCGLCPCFHFENPMYCQAVKADKNKKIVNPYGAPRPEWCPLKEQEAVVRCKDCKHRPKEPNFKTYESGFDIEFPEGSKCPCRCSGDGFYSWYPEDDWFCANGERR